MKKDKYKVNLKDLEEDFNEDYNPKVLKVKKAYNRKNKKFKNNNFDEE